MQDVSQRRRSCPHSQETVEAKKSVSFQSGLKGPGIDLARLIVELDRHMAGMAVNLVLAV